LSVITASIVLDENCSFSKANAIPELNQRKLAAHNQYIIFAVNSTFPKLEKFYQELAEEFKVF
jgi:hypothetical protein